MGQDKLAMSKGKKIGIILVIVGMLCNILHMGFSGSNVSDFISGFTAGVGIVLQVAGLVYIVIDDKKKDDN